MTITVSLVMLTMNRMEAVEQSLTANLASAGYPVREIIHVDNGSDPGFAHWFKCVFNPAIQVLHATNLGVAKGYNRGMLLATSSHIVITGCDRLMPKQWLLEWVKAAQLISNTGAISCYTAGRGGGTEILNGVAIRYGRPLEARMHSRNFLLGAGFFREDLDLYGYEDVEWSDRAERYARIHGLVNYTLPDLGLASHLKFEGTTRSYVEMKNVEHSVEWKRQLVRDCHRLGNPFYNPYSRIEGVYEREPK